MVEEAGYSTRFDPESGNQYGVTTVDEDVTKLLWDVANDSYLMETDANGDTTAEYTNEPGQFGELVSQRRGNATSNYHFDAQKSTRQLTAEDGNVTETATYVAFGDAVATSYATDNPFRYLASHGYYSHEFSDHIYVRNRCYCTTIARWMSQDPLEFWEAASQYAYVKNCPVTLADPSGLFSQHLTRLLDTTLSSLGVAFCFAEHVTPFYDRMQTKGNGFAYADPHLGAKGSLESQVMVLSKGFPGTCDTDAYVIAAFEGRSVTPRGGLFDSTGNLIRLSELITNASVRTGTRCSELKLQPYAIPESSTADIKASGIGVVVICRIPCDDSLQCKKVSNDTVIYSKDFSGSYQTRPGQLILWQWRVCPESLAGCCDLVGCKAATHVTQLLYGFNYGYPGSPYVGPPWGINARPIVEIGNEPRPSGVLVQRIISQHKSRGGSTVAEAC